VMMMMMMMMIIIIIIIAELSFSSYVDVGIRLNYTGMGYVSSHDIL